ncbi:MAG: cysteine desulfurase [Arenicellales bacterium]|nr:cysteine desulfurase [Arenicellales bacterium]MDP6791346.1 cysteine desulfurase [Arenicellales bacterium]MDP6919333.1 cysteine desulfurase [Arenicellales bacterium]|tara:strand:- start:46008 stop:47261 length:1254 start_codon:yes stop_codon:yes gene_type:complete
MNPAAGLEPVAALDAAALRRDFPILHQQINGHPLVYLDNGATTQKPASVIDAVAEFYHHDNANVHRGVHLLSQRASDRFDSAREQVRSLINAASTAEVIFTRGTTEAINLVAQSYGRSTVKSTDEILVSAMEHHANIVPWQLLCEETGATLRVAPMNDSGELLTDAFTELLSEKTRIVALTHVSNALGTVNPVRTFARLAHAAGAVVVVDGAQSVAHGPVDVQQLECDFFAFSGHKLYGPTGIGVLYGREALLEDMPPWQGGGDMIRTVSFEGSTWNTLPHKFEAGTPHIAGAVGLSAAIDYLNGIGFDAIAAHEQALLGCATEKAKSQAGMRIIGNASDKAAIVSFELEGIHPHDVGTILDSAGVTIRTGHHCAMPVMQFFGVPATARASFGLYNTTDDIDALFVAIDKAQALFAR